MVTVIILFEAVNNNLLLGVMPESVGLMLFGAMLIAFAVSLRWFFNRSDEKGNFDQTATNVHQKRRA